MKELSEASFKVENGVLTITTPKGKRPYDAESLRAVSAQMRNENDPQASAPVLVSSRGNRYKVGIYSHPNGTQWRVLIFESALVAIGEVPSRSKVSMVQAAVETKGKRRYRRCPKCGSVVEAGKLACLTLGANWGVGGLIRQCPVCGVQATTASFALVKAPA